MRHDSSIYMCTPTLLINILYIHYIHGMVVIDSLLRFKIKFPMVHSYIYIFQSRDCHVFSLVTVVGICIIYACVAAVTHSVTVHSYETILIRL